MTSKLLDSPISQSELLAEKVIRGVILRLYSNRIFHVTILPFKKIDMSMIQIGYDFIEENGGGKFYNIFQFDSFSDIEPEVRDWAADHNGNLHTLSDAIVVKRLSQKILADFYLRHNKPVKPTKIFYSLDNAYEWTNMQMNMM